MKRLSFGKILSITILIGSPCVALPNIALPAPQFDTKSVQLSLKKETEDIKSYIQETFGLRINAFQALTKLSAPMPSNKAKINKTRIYDKTNQLKGLKLANGKMNIEPPPSN